MRFVIFTHSLISDWNHGNAHFLRGTVSELQQRGHQVRIFEPRDGWSLQHLLQEEGSAAVRGFERAYPHLRSEFYDLESLKLDRALEGVDVVLVHEWNPHELVQRIGEHRRSRGDYRLYFHDTHHRSITDQGSMAAYDLTQFDGVLAYGGVIRDAYIQNGWAKSAWTWHEAADVRRFRPLAADRCEGDLVWIGNWGDEERAEEIEEFLIRPVVEMRLRARVYGVRYPKRALDALAAAGIEYGGRLPNYRVPEVFARFRVTIHIPRRPYARALPGIPTIRPFEALACGIPLVSAPWDDCECLFRAGDFRIARDWAEMTGHLRELVNDPKRAAAQSARGLATIRAWHTCGHRVEELMEIVRITRAAAHAEGAVECR